MPKKQTKENLIANGIDGFAHHSGDETGDKFSSCMLTVADLTYEVMPFCRVDWFFRIDGKYVKIFPQKNHVIVETEGWKYCAHLIRIVDGITIEEAGVTKEYSKLCLDILTECSPLTNENIFPGDMNAGQKEPPTLSKAQENEKPQFQFNHALNRMPNDERDKVLSGLARILSSLDIGEAQAWKFCAELEGHIIDLQKKGK